MGWGGGWRAITFLGTCTHVMCYVMGFWVVRLMLTCAWGGTSREMFNVPGCPDAEKKGDQAMRCSLWLTSQFEQRSICVFSSYNIYIYMYLYLYIYLFISILSPLHLHHPWRETCYIMSFFYIINILMTFSKNCRRTVGARLRPDRPFLVTSLYTFFFGG